MYCHVLQSEAAQLYQQRLTLYPHKTVLCIAAAEHGSYGSSILLLLGFSSNKLSSPEKQACWSFVKTLDLLKLTENDSETLGGFYAMDFCLDRHSCFYTWI